MLIVAFLSGDQTGKRLGLNTFLYQAIGVPVNATGAIAQSMVTAVTSVGDPIVAAYFLVQKLLAFRANEPKLGITT
jgi:hypothetical protein